MPGNRIAPVREGKHGDELALASRVIGSRYILPCTFDVVIRNNAYLGGVVMYITA